VCQQQRSAVSQRIVSRRTCSFCPWFDGALGFWSQEYEKPTTSPRWKEDFINDFFFPTNATGTLVGFV
jgi:hypothetical protein